MAKKQLHQNIKSIVTIVMTAILLTISGCFSHFNPDDEVEVPAEVKKMPSDIQSSYKTAILAIQTLQYSIGLFEASKSVEDFITIVKNYNDLSFEYDGTTLTEEQKLECAKLKYGIDSIRQELHTIITTNIKNIGFVIANKSDYLMKETEEFPIYLQKGNGLKIDVIMATPADIKVYNVDSRTVIKSYSGKTKIHDSLIIPNKAIYTVEINPRKAQYADICIQQYITSPEQLNEIKEVKMTTVNCKKGDFRAKSVKGVNMQNLFEEPRKFTLRGQLKSMFSGSSRALVAVQVPKGASDILYSLRISTTESDRYSDGNFKGNMDVSYRKVKFLGLPLYESHGGSGLLSTLLGENQPPREEDAYINMYVFYNSAQAKKFQDGVHASELSYNVDYSTLGSQSCNGRIPAKGSKTIYLAFENERMRYNNYIWLEAISAVPTTEYFNTEYNVEEE